MAIPVEHTGWLERVQLLDDVPIDGDGARDFLGLTALAQNLAESLLEGEGRPMVIHVDGAWGRGKTSFCNCLRARLQTFQRPSTAPSRSGVTDVGTAWYVASDDDVNAADAIMYQVVRAAIGEDAEEIASLMSRFASSANPDIAAEPRFDAFRQWLSRELGWSAQHIAARGGEIRLAPRSSTEPASTGSLKLTPRSVRRQLAVIFIDDLDRCGPAWVSALLDSIRRYVNCRGVVFVIAADKRVISAAFDDVVQSLGVTDRITGGEALEKYIRHSVQIPSWGINASADFGAKLRDLQSALDRRARELMPIIRGPGRDLQLGVGFKLALYLSDSLSPRRLKRLLTKFTVDIARFADLAGISAEHLRPGSESSVWRDLRNVRPAFGAVEARVEHYAGFFFGRIITLTLEELWPESLRDLALDSREFDERIRSLASLGTALQAEKDVSLPGMSLRIFTRALDALVPPPPAAATPLAVKRECCELIASLFADLERTGAFSPKRATYFVPTAVETTPTTVDEAVPQVTISGSAVAGHASASAPDVRSPFDSLDAETAAATLRKLRISLEDVSAPALLLPWIRAVQVAQALPSGSEGANAANLQLELARWAASAWPPTLAAVEYADELIRFGLHDSAFKLLLESPLTASTSSDWAWAATERLEQLLTRYPPLRTQLPTNLAVPPWSPTDSAAAFRAHLRLTLLERTAGSVLKLRADHESPLIAAIADLVRVLPDIAWPARLAVHLIQPGETQYLPTARAIANVLVRTNYGLSGDDLSDIALRLTVLLRVSTGDATLVLQVYALLEDAEALPLSELHNLALLKRQQGDLVGAALCWEQAYRNPEFPPEAEREFVDLLRGLGQSVAAERVVARMPLDERLFSGAMPRVAATRPLQPTALLSTAHIADPLDVLVRLRESGRVTPVVEPGLHLELTLSLFRHARATTQNEDRLRIEAALWADASWLDEAARGRIELAELMLEFGYLIEAHDGLRASELALRRMPTPPFDLLWLNWSAVVDREQLAERWADPAPMVVRPWNFAFHTPSARGLAVAWISGQLYPSIWRSASMTWIVDWLAELSIGAESDPNFQPWLSQLGSDIPERRKEDRWVLTLLRLTWLVDQKTMQFDTVAALIENSERLYAPSDVWILGRALRDRNPQYPLIGELWMVLYATRWRAAIAAEFSAWAANAGIPAWVQLASEIAQGAELAFPGRRPYQFTVGPVP